ncbi:MAG: NUDIX hydrolase, partial [Anaerolineae bacterium]|nr:NUDIX hydrolase [Anaerolineae bacterium]
MAATAFFCDPDDLHHAGCGYVHYENPVPGVGLLIEHEGQLVLIRRGHPPHVGEWALPSGFIEVDETAEQAAVREAYEETGLQVELTELFSVHSFPEGPPRSGIIVFIAPARWTLAQCKQAMTRARFNSSPSRICRPCASAPTVRRWTAGAWLRLRLRPCPPCA